MSEWRRDTTPNVQCRHCGAHMEFRWESNALTTLALRHPGTTEVLEGVAGGDVPAWAKWVSDHCPAKPQPPPPTSSPRGPWAAYFRSN